MRILPLKRSVIFALITVIFASSIVSANEVDSGRKAAKLELKKFPKHVGDRIGFETEADVTNADVGLGFRVYTIDHAKIVERSAPLDFEACVLPTSDWLYIVVNGNKALSLLEMNFQGARWSAGSLGSAEFARALNNILKAWPAAAGYQYRYFRIYGPRIDFFEISHSGRVIGIIELIPTKIDSMASPNKVFHSNDLRSPKELWSVLLPSIRRNIEWHRKNNASSK